MSSRDKGTRYEAYAARYLEDQGYRIVDQNYRSRRAEIDIVAWDGEYLVFVEVKYRRDLTYGEPYEAVDVRKQARIRQAAAVYLSDKRYPPDTPCRFDVVSILGREVTLFKNAF